MLTLRQLTLALLSLGFSGSNALVQVEQYGMAQCPMTSTLTTDFWNDCFVHGVGVKDIVNYTLNMVGGSHGGPLEPNSSQWNSSFHGDQEIVADKYQLCARALEPAPVVGTYKWVNFTSCLNGYQGIAICTYYLPHEIQDAAKICAEATGYEPKELNDCVTGEQGTALYKASAIYTSNQISKKVIPPYGTGKDQGIPIIRIAGKTYTGTIGAFNELGKRICEAAGSAAPKDCGCFRHYPGPSDAQTPTVWPQQH